MNRFKQYLYNPNVSFDRKIYVVGTIAAVAFTVFCVGYYYLARWAGWDFLVECQMKAMLGVPCPGCGGTHALMYFLKGDLLAAARYNIFAVYCGVMALVYFLSHTINIMTKGRTWAMKFRPMYLYLGLAIAIVNFGIKAILLLVWDIEII